MAFFPAADKKKEDSMLILLADAFQADLPGRLEVFGEVTQDHGRVGEAEIIIVRSKTKVDKAMIDKAPRLKFVIRGGVGVDTIDVPYAESKGITVVNTPEASSVAVAELAFAMMIAMPARIAEADASMKQGKWLKKEMERTELLGKTLGLIGIGRIARELSARAKAFGMRVIAHDKYVEKSDAAEMMSLDTVYAQSDYISLHTPLTDETRGMINAVAIAKMKPGAHVINTCRGQVIVEADVAAALIAGRLAGYAADVYDKEPPEGSPLLSAPHTVFTPHIGASTEENLSRLGDSIVNRVQAYVAKK
jgi:D-3-phosphoglycerate dehydrogenase